MDRDGLTPEERRAIDTLEGYIRCQCCQTPVAQVRGDTLRIVARHHGEKHTSVFTRADLVAFLEMMGYTTTGPDIAEVGDVG